jgi:membrane protein
MKHPIVAAIREVLQRGKEVRAPQLVSAIALRALLSFLPMLLLAVGILGLVARGRTGLGDDVVEWLGISGDFANVVRDAVAQSGEGNGSLVAVIFSSALLLPSALGVFAAVATACDAVWQVPGRGFVDQLLGIPWVLGLIVIVAASGFATSLVSLIPIPFLGIVAALAGAAVSGALLCIWTHWILTNARLPWKAHLPGAVVLGMLAAVIQVAGTALMQRFLASAEAWGAFAGVFAFIALLNLVGQAIVWSSVINVIRWERTHGTIRLASSAPALGVDHWVEVGRGGSRQKRKKFKSPNRQRWQLRR